LFDAIDESDTMELDGVAKQLYWNVVDHCYLCDICFMTKCPYFPPHEWNVDFPHLMLRAKAVKFKKDGVKFRDRFLTSTDRKGWDLTALVPSCVLMFKQELPLFFPDDAQVLKVRDAFFDPFEYLSLRLKENKLKTDFKTTLGKVAYHAACHQRVQNFGLKTCDILQLVGDTQVETIERCVQIKLAGFDPVTPIANEDLEQETEKKISAVHFLRFELTSEMIAAVKQGAAISVAIDHSAYRYQTGALPEATRASLVRDLN
jgi:hypothetical protein